MKWLTWGLADLNKLGGLVVVTRELDHSDADTRKMAAWVLGKASQNNPIVQKQVCSAICINFFECFFFNVLCA